MPPQKPVDPEVKPIDPEVKPAVLAGPTIIVIAAQPGRRRIGRAFGPEPVAIPMAELTEGDIAALRDDPLLAVSVVDAPY